MFWPAAPIAPAGEMPDRPVSVGGEADARLFGDEVERLEEGLVDEVDVDGAGFVTSVSPLALWTSMIAVARPWAWARLSASVSRIPFPLERDLRRAQVGLIFLLVGGDGRIRSIRSARVLLGVERPPRGGRSVGRQGQRNSISDFSAAARRLDLGRLEPLDELRHPVPEGRFRDLLAGRDRDHGRCQPPPGPTPPSSLFSSEVLPRWIVRSSKWNGWDR